MGMFNLFRPKQLADRIEPGFQAKATPAIGSGGGQLTPVAPPKVKPKQSSVPSFAKSATASTAVLLRNDLNAANVDIVQQYRFSQDTYSAIRNLAQLSPDLSTALSAYLRVGIPEKYIALARNSDGSINDQATSLAMQILQRFDKLPGYEGGFTTVGSIQSVAESLGKEGMLYGAMALELVLDKGRLPAQLVPISTSQLKFYQDGSGLRPVQVVGGEEVDLDIPTFFYVSLDQNLLQPYADSPFESAIQPVLAAQQLQNDLRQICARNAYPRLDVTIDYDKLAKLVPQDIQGDPEKTALFYTGAIAQVTDMVNSAGVDEALVHFDFVKVAYLSEDGNMPSTFDTLKGIFDAKVATGARALPAILGHGAGSQNVASTETTLFMLSANSMVRRKLQEIFSRALTLAVRLFGQDVTVEFIYDSIDLRPEAELEAFRTMRSERLLRQLSLGLIGDVEAALRLTGALPPAGYVPLSGTRFMDNQPVAISGNPYSGTSNGSGSGGATDTKQRQPGTPTGAKGPQKAK